MVNREKVVLAVVNMVLWCTYDVLSKSFGALSSHIPLLLFTVAGMIIHDRKNKDSNASIGA